MKIIKEPYSIDLEVDGSSLTAKDLAKVDEAISHYKSMKNQKKTDLRRKSSKIVKQ